MKRFVWILALLVFSVSVSAASPDECYSDCKLGPYGDCLAAGGAEQDCYKTAFEPCAAQCPQPPAPEPTPAAPVASVRVPQAEQVAMTCEEACKAHAYEEVSRSPAAVGAEQLVMQFYERCVKERCQRESVPSTQVVVPALPLAQPAPLCPPPSEEATCEIRCAHSYYGCMNKAEGLMVSEERKNLMLHCYEGVGECLDTCRPEMIEVSVPEPAPVMPEELPDCVTGCKQEHEACSESSTDESECKMRADACFRKCAPQTAMPAEAAPRPVPPSPPAQPQGFWKRLAQTLFS